MLQGDPPYSVEDNDIEPDKKRNIYNCLTDKLQALPRRPNSACLVEGISRKKVLFLMSLEMAGNPVFIF